jgi:hypothetical protein
MATETHRLRGLVFRWRREADTACAKFHDYKSKRYCYTCAEPEWKHDRRRCADELEALLAEPAMVAAPLGE